MVSEGMDLGPEPRMENGLNSQMVFQDESLQFNCGGTPQAQQRRINDPGRKTRELSGFVTEKMFSVEGERYFPPQGAEFRRSIYGNSPVHQDRPENQNWNGEGSTESGDGSEGDEEDDDDDEDDEVDEGDGEVEGLVVGEDGSKHNNSSGSVHSSSEKIRNEKANLQKHHPSLGSRGALLKDGNGVHSANNIRGSSSEQQHHQQGRVAHYENAVTIAEPDMYYSQFLQGSDGSTLGQKEIGGENGCGFGGGKDVPMSMESGESLRAILSDPITGSLMDDAMILPCGHSFGSGGMQHVIRMHQRQVHFGPQKACYTCSQSVPEDSVAPNLCSSTASKLLRSQQENGCAISLFHVQPLLIERAEGRDAIITARTS